MKLNSPKRNSEVILGKIHEMSTMEISEDCGSSNCLYCPFCNINFDSKLSVKEHCLTDQHHAVILSDEGRDWKFRPPPRGILANDYKLCQCAFESNSCRFGSQCIQAHSENELEEWKERFLYRTMKIGKAKQKELHGETFADRLLEKFTNSQNLHQVFSENIERVTCEVSSDVSICISEKPSEYVWTVTLVCPFQINAVALLHDSHRTHFFLTSLIISNNDTGVQHKIKLNKIQEWTNQDLPSQVEGPNQTLNMKYIIEVTFYTEIYGTFRQTLAVDFGFPPVFIKKFCVDILPIEDEKCLKSVHTILVTKTERWCEENTEIIPFDSNNEPVESDCLMAKYPCPTSENIFVNQSSLEKYPTKNNYVTRMHDLLFFEEIAQFQLISNFNIKSSLHLTKIYLPDLMMEAKYALLGELYAKLDLTAELSEDTPHGRLILNNCNTILISLVNESESSKNVKERRAYEALIEGKTKKEIFLRLSQECVRDLSLEEDTDISVDIQLQLNRTSFCEMHFALDTVSCFDSLFPDVISGPTIPWNPGLQWNEYSCSKFNLKQKEAEIAIASSLDTKLPPVLIIGPFGTGKTFTIAQTLKQILTQPNTNILVCTYSNSAADVYISSYLHLWFKSGSIDVKPLRIYYRNRRVETVPKVVRQYCLTERAPTGQEKFRSPTKEEILNCRIILTTINTSIYLTHLGIGKGHFSHILIDEAAQVMECSTIIPLSLANSKTRIVLAGDYMQLSPEVFSPLSLEKNLQKSLLERLYDLYPADHPCKIMLVDNYRSHSGIIKYTSAFFYDGKLVSRGKVMQHPKFHSLTFFTVRGEDIQDTVSTAFYNNAEVMEVCEVVSGLLKTWPVKEWGPIRAEAIGVVTPYLDQVLRIRSALRKKKLYNVSVERVLNVQGKEFRAVIISPVRTRHTCLDNDSSLEFGFLSNAKLLTTAITRAQSLVAAVGDPISLCSVGKCRKLWEEFIKQCANAGSLYGMTLASLKAHLDGLEYKKIYGLNPMAQEFIPRYFILPAAPFQTYYPYSSPLPNLPPVALYPYQQPSYYIPSMQPIANPQVAPFRRYPPLPNYVAYPQCGNIFPNHMFYQPYNQSWGNFPAGGYNQFGLYQPYPPQQPHFGFQVHKSYCPVNSASSVTDPSERKREVCAIRQSAKELNLRGSSGHPNDKNFQFLNNVHFPNGPDETRQLNDYDTSRTVQLKGLDTCKNMQLNFTCNAVTNEGGSKLFNSSKFDSISNLFQRNCGAETYTGALSPDFIDRKLSEEVSRLTSDQKGDSNKEQRRATPSTTKAVHLTNSLAVTSADSIEFKLREVYKKTLNRDDCADFPGPRNSLKDTDPDFQMWCSGANSFPWKSGSLTVMTTPQRLAPKKNMELLLQNRSSVPNTVPLYLRTSALSLETSKGWDNMTVSRESDSVSEPQRPQEGCSDGDVIRAKTYAGVLHSKIYQAGRG